MTRHYTVRDSQSCESGLSYVEAIDAIHDWYHDVADWNDGDGTDEQHAAIRQAIAETPSPVEGGTLADLREYADDICRAVAEAMGLAEFCGHGDYRVSAADGAGIGLAVDAEVTEDEVEAYAAEAAAHGDLVGAAIALAAIGESYDHVALSAAERARVDELTQDAAVDATRDAIVRAAD